MQDGDAVFAIINSSSSHHQARAVGGQASCCSGCQRCPASQAPDPIQGTLERCPAWPQTGVALEEQLLTRPCCIRMRLCNQQRKRFLPERCYMHHVKVTFGFVPFVTPNTPTLPASEGLMLFSHEKGLLWQKHWPLPALATVVAESLQGCCLFMTDLLQIKYLRGAPHSCLMAKPSRLVHSTVCHNVIA